MIGDRKTDIRTINGFELTTVQLPSMRGSRLRFRLAKLLAPAAGALRGKSLTDLQALDVADIAPAIMAIATQLDDAAHDALMLELLICTSVVVDGPSGKVKYDLTKAAAIDQAFGSDVDALWAAAKTSLEVNLGGFFGASAGSAAPQVPTPSS